MTETLIVKYSFVLYSFKFLTSLPKFRDIKNNIIQHYWWMRFPRKLWMYSMILEVKLAYVIVFVYACLFTIWRQNTFLTNESSAAQTSYQYSIWLCTANDPLCTANDHIMVILHNGCELQSWEMRHSPKHFDEIASLFSASCPFGKLSVRQNVRSAKCPGTCLGYPKGVFGSIYDYMTMTIWLMTNDYMIITVWLWL